MTSSADPKRTDTTRWLALAALSAVALAARELAARTVGFGDSEALYASYALYPQPAYLDHPGLIGLVARALAGGHAAPTPLGAHAVTAVLATLAPLWAGGACRLLGASTRAALGAALAVAVAPEVAVGLFALTPDLLLFFGWLGALALFGRGLREAPASTRAAGYFCAAGVVLGLACSSKVSGLALALSFAVCLATRPARGHARTIWPWVTLTLAALLFAPIVLFEARSGWPMLRHRLIDTQADAALSLRNAGAILGGQAAYISPLLAFAGVVVGRRLFLERGRDPVTALLASATFVPFAVLGALCLWSRVAEPHWLAPAWLALPLFYACEATASSRPLLSSGVRGWALGSALACTTLVYGWVLVPTLVKVVPEASYDPRLDLANELVGWPQVTKDLLAMAGRHAEDADGPPDIVVVGPVWMVCAQLRAALPPSIPVGCAGPRTADFAGWNPPRAWSHTPFVFFVHDNRAAADSASLFPDRAAIATRERTIERGGRVARVFTIEVLALRATGASGARDASRYAFGPVDEAVEAGAMGESPASRRSARSSDSAGFGVVRSFSP